MDQHSDSNQPHRPYPRVVAYPPKPRRHKPVNPYAAANALAMQHQDIADKVAINISRRTGHPVDDLRQIAMMGIIQASRRYEPQKRQFRQFARTYANGEVFHYLRDKGFTIKVPPSWRQLHARGRKLIEAGICEQELLRKLGISAERWRDIREACGARTVAFNDSSLDLEEGY